MSLSHMKWKNSPIQFRDNYIARDVPMSCDIPNHTYLLVSLDFAPSLVVVAGGAPPPNLAKKPTKLDFCSFNICSSRFLSSSKTSSPCSSIHFFIASYPSVACARTTSNGRTTSPGLVVGGMTGGRARNPKRREMKEGPVSAVGVGRSVFESAWGGVSLGRSRGGEGGYFSGHGFATGEFVRYGDVLSFCSGFVFFQDGSDILEVLARKVYN